MSARLLQRWLTVRGDAGAGVQSIPQGNGGWVDTGDAVDATFVVDCREAKLPGDGVVTLNLETSPSKDEVSFAPVVQPMTLAGSATPVVVRTMVTPATVPLARWLRWRLSTTATGGVWDATMRIAMTTSPFSYFTPTQLSGCKLWLRADQGITIATGVSQWNDLSGNGNNMVQATGAKQPTYSATAGPGNTPALGFNGSSSYMTGPLITTQSQNFTIFIVVQPLDLTTLNQFVLAVGYTAGWGFYTSAGSRVTMEIGIGGGTFGTNSGAWEEWCWYDTAGSNRTAEVNGAPITTSTNLTLSAPNTGSVLCAYNGGAANWAKVNLAEVIVYTRTLSAAERTRVTRYIGGRYGIAVP